MTGGVEDGAAIGNAGGVAELQAEAFDAGSQVPGIDPASIDRRLATHRIQTDPIQEGGQERVAAKRLVKPGDARRGARERVRESEVDFKWRGWRGEELVKHHAVLRVGAARPQTGSRCLKRRGFRHSGKKTLSLGVCTGKAFLITGLALWRCTPLSDAPLCISAPRSDAALSAGSCKNHNEFPFISTGWYYRLS